MSILQFILFISFLMIKGMSFCKEIQCMSVSASDKSASASNMSHTNMYYFFCVLILCLMATCIKGMSTSQRNDCIDDNKLKNTPGRLTICLF